MIPTWKLAASFSILISNMTWNHPEVFCYSTLLLITKLRRVPLLFGSSVQSRLRIPLSSAFTYIKRTITFVFVALMLWKTKSQCSICFSNKRLLFSNKYIYMDLDLDIFKLMSIYERKKII